MEHVEDLFTHTPWRSWKDLKKCLKQYYNFSIFTTIRRLEQECRRRERLLSHIIFLKRCRKDGLIPKGFRIKNQWNNAPKMRRTIQVCEGRLMKQTIGSLFQQLKQTDANIRNLEDILKTEAPDVCQDVLIFIREGCRRFRENMKTKKLKKLEELRSRTVDEILPSSKYRTVGSSVVNLSSRELTLNETKILELGLNFAVPYKHHKDLLIEAAINTENGLRQVSSKDEAKLDKVRFEVAKILNSEKNKPDPTVKKYSWIKKYVTGLQRDRSIKILPADKGNVTVIVDSDWYNDKIQALLDDQAYSVIQHDPTKRVEQDIRTICRNLKKFKKLNESQFAAIVPTNSSLPRFYGLPKLHKDGIPLRPIVDFRSSPSYKLAKFLSSLLQPVADQHEFKLQNSYHFVDQIKNLRIPEGHAMISFDVVSLFTKVPVYLTKEYIRHRLEICLDWKHKTNLWHKDVMQLLDLAISNNYFTYEGIIYWQENGTPMGSPISPVFAEFSMQHLEEERVLHNTTIHFWTRFVDDCFAVIPEGKEDSILSNLNSFHPDLQFTYELEESHALPFLDTLLERDDNGNIHRSVFRKKTHSGRYLNFQSYHPMAHKISVVDSLAFRAFVICDDDHISSELSLIESQLMDNGYPKAFIQKRFERMKIRTQNWTYGNNLRNEDDEDKPRIILPYMGPLTNRITNLLRNELNCNFGYLPGLKLKQIICHYKDKKKELVGIYRITCSCSLVYVGETNRSLEIRTKEHVTNRDSVVFQHLSDNPTHSLGRDSASLLEKEYRYFHRTFKEHLWILKHPNRINLNSGMRVSPIWDASLLPLMRIPSADNNGGIN